jgi:hypothetical protein
MAAAMSAAGSIRQRFTPAMLKARAADFSEAACLAGYMALFNRLVLQSEARSTGQ